MNSAIERLLSLRIKDVMNANVVTVCESDEMRTAARRIFEAEVTGVPVVNEQGKCVGMLSASDFVARDAGDHDLQILTQTAPDAPYQVERLDDRLVGTHMAPQLLTIADDALIMSAARVMCTEGIHRLVVVDEEGRPVGLVSTLDLIASMVAAIDE